MNAKVNCNTLVKKYVYSEDILIEDIDTDYIDALLRKPTEQ